MKNVKTFSLIACAASLILSFIADYLDSKSIETDLSAMLDEKLKERGL